MNSLKTFEQFDFNSLPKEQIKFLNKFVSGSWNLVNGFVDVEGDFYCVNKVIKDFKGIKFGKISGSFACVNNRLTSLEGCPQKVGNNFNCSNNRLTSLEGCPQEVGQDFYCAQNRLTSLLGAPQEVGNDFDCSENLLTSLAGAPQKVGRNFLCHNNLLTSLIGAPQGGSGNFYCFGNRLTSLEGYPQNLDGYRLENNLVSEETLRLLWNKLKEIPIYPIALASIWSKIPEKDQELMKKDLDPDYLDYSSMGDFGLI